MTRSTATIFATMKKSVENIEDLQNLVGTVVGPTRWIEVTQELIDRFAAVSGDHQWIHVDPQRAEAESPFGSTVAHGDLTLSLINGYRSELIEMTGAKMAINYGWDKVRFPAPVPVNSRVRFNAELLTVESRGEDWWQTVTRFTVYRHGEDKPVCVADSVGRILFPH